MNMAAAANAMQHNHGQYSNQGGSQQGWPMFLPPLRSRMDYKGVSVNGSSSGEKQSKQHSAFTDSSNASERRLAAVKKYKEKKRLRTAGASNKIRYERRKVLAQARPRVRGQFVQTSSREGDSRTKDEIIASNQNEKTNIEFKNVNETKKRKSLTKGLESRKSRRSSSKMDTAVADWQSSMTDSEGIKKELVSGSDNGGDNMVGGSSNRIPESSNSRRPGSTGFRSESGSNSPNNTAGKPTV